MAQEDLPVSKIIELENCSPSNEPRVQVNLPSVVEKTMKRSQRQVPIIKIQDTSECNDELEAKPVIEYYESFSCKVPLIVVQDFSFTNDLPKIVIQDFSIVNISKHKFHIPDDRPIIDHYDSPSHEMPQIIIQDFSSESEFEDEHLVLSGITLSWVPPQEIPKLLIRYAPKSKILEKTSYVCNDNQNPEVLEVQIFKDLPISSQDKSESSDSRKECIFNTSDSSAFNSKSKDKRSASKKPKKSVFQSMNLLSKPEMEVPIFKASKYFKNETQRDFLSAKSLPDVTKSSFDSCNDVSTPSKDILNSLEHIDSEYECNIYMPNLSATYSKTGGGSYVSEIGNQFRSKFMQLLSKSSDIPLFKASRFFPKIQDTEDSETQRSAPNFEIRHNLQNLSTNGKNEIKSILSKQKRISPAQSALEISSNVMDAVPLISSKQVQDPQVDDVTENSSDGEKEVALILSTLAEAPEADRVPSILPNNEDEIICLSSEEVDISEARVEIKSPARVTFQQPSNPTVEQSSDFYDYNNDSWNESEFPEEESMCAKCTSSWNERQDVRCAIYGSAIFVICLLLFTLIFVLTADREQYHLNRPKYRFIYNVTNASNNESNVVASDWILV
ncbi:uncharacterized protein LOC106652247 [Trichogramma pretiosum]|uniref:uncharacterized protein LOC106652247 n=1 Tax=Trichogramma pretiosum TaxID=7493 RepID=UPI0006C98271|nr:uncharacterized protein LOC106652247 [Trichogramma pretiosum]